MTNSVRQLLQEARNLITPINHWTRYELARDSRGNSLNPEDPEACSWCALGAVDRIGMDDRWSAKDLHRSRIALNDVAKGKYRENIAILNDFESHQSVLDAFDQAIKELSDE